MEEYLYNKRIIVNVLQEPYGMVMDVQKDNNAKMEGNGMFLNLCVNAQLILFGMALFVSE